MKRDGGDAGGNSDEDEFAVPKQSAKSTNSSGNSNNNNGNSNTGNNGSNGSKLICAHCSTQLPASARFCLSCGAPVAASNPALLAPENRDALRLAVAAAPFVPGAVPAATMPASMVKTPRERKNKGRKIHLKNHVQGSCRVTCYRRSCCRSHV